MTRFRCPDSNRVKDDVVGCGRTFDAEPDHEGLVDCPHCGIWFSPAKEPHTILTHAVKDVYILEAATIFKCRPEDVTPQQRQYAKTVWLGKLYDPGALEALLKKHGL